MQGTEAALGHVHVKTMSACVANGRNDAMQSLVQRREATTRWRAGTRSASTSKAATQTDVART